MLKMVKNDIIGELIEIIDNEDVLEEGLNELLTDQQLFVIRKLKNKTFNTEDRVEAYKQGINMAEMGEYTNCTRAAVSKYLNRVMGSNKEEVEKSFYENREKLYYARNWYFYVYKSDIEGDYRQIKQYLSSTIKEDSIAYIYYKDYGGKKLGKLHEDKRSILAEDKVERILKRLEDEPIEKVAFSERVKLETVENVVEKNNAKAFYEEEIGETEYTEKLNRWLDRKEKLRQQELKRLKEERRKNKNEVEDERTN